MNQDGTTSLDVCIGKVFLYSRQYNLHKFLKYLRLLRCPKKNSTPSIKYIAQPVEVILRKKGALQVIQSTLKMILGNPIVDADDDTTTSPTSQEMDGDDSEDDNSDRNAIVNEGLSILGNAFAIDPEARKEAVKYDIITILQRVMVHPQLLFIDAIQTRAIKCLGNICGHATHFITPEENSLRPQITRSGIVNSLLQVIHNIKKKLKRKVNPVCPPSISREKRALLRTAVRAIRILAGDLDTKNYLLRLDAIIIVGDILVWQHFELEEDLAKEILRALTVMTEKFRTARHEVVCQVRVSGEAFLKELVRLFGSTDVGKPFTFQLIHCLTNLATNKDIAYIFNHEQIFKIIFERLEMPMEFSKLEQIVKLLRELVTQDAVIHSYLLPHSYSVSSTLKILRSPQLAAYHYFILNFYENLHGSSIPDLTSYGLINLLQDLLKENYKNCTYDSVRTFLCSIESDVCPAHSAAAQECPFLPVYRCTSPSYLQVQKEVKEYLEARTMIDAELTGCIRRNSWNGNFSDEESAGCYSPYTEKSCSPISSTVGSDDDEGVGGESDVFPDIKFEFSEVEDEAGTESLSSNSNINLKRRKLNVRSPIPIKINREEPQEETSTHAPVPAFKDQLIRIKTIAAIIEILKKLMRIKPFKAELLTFTPSLLALLCDGKLSCMNFENSLDSSGSKDEKTTLNMRCFYGSDSILRKFFSEIGNFQHLVEAGIIPLLNRLSLLGQEKEETNEELMKCNSMLHNLIPILAGDDNNTSGEEHNSSGWRKGHLVQSLGFTSNPAFKQQAVLAIPLLFQSDHYYLRQISHRNNAWSELFITLGLVDEISNSLFQDTIMSLAALCNIFGMRWTEQEEYLKKRQLVSPMHNYTGAENAPTVILELDNKECISVEKQYLTKASPVFEAMFDGHFLEAEEQRVKLPNATKKAVYALIHQIKASEIECTGQTEPPYDLLTVLELISLSNRFLLADVQDKTFTSILSSYLCPYSAPTIYEHAIQTSSYEKPESLKWIGQFNFPAMVLKYLLVGPGISCGLKCSAFKKIFDRVEPCVVIQDLKCLFEHYAKESLSFPTPKRRLNKVNIMLKT